MPWCGIWGWPVSPFWWVLPLIGVVFLAILFFFCWRSFGRFGCMGGRRREPGETCCGPAAPPGRPT